MPAWGAFSAAPEIRRAHYRRLHSEGESMTDQESRPKAKAD
ncbi:hypothetical protein [Streptomyces ossamyceticus]|uniref:Uncharacterized protein n=1 Tax=Streptomyces ossamyceticus TaxID=249581 RepID=A0ABV2V210_9ACTN